MSKYRESNIVVWSHCVNIQGPKIRIGIFWLTIRCKVISAFSSPLSLECWQDVVAKRGLWSESVGYFSGENGKGDGDEEDVLFCFILVLSASIDAKAQGWKGLPILVLLVWIKGWLDNVLAETELSFYIVHPQPRLVNFYAFQTFFQNKNCRLERDLNTLTIWRQQPPRPQTELSFLYFVNPSTGEKFNFSLDFLAQHFIRIKESSKAVAARWTLYAC